jgi:hypothetical protein
VLSRRHRDQRSMLLFRCVHHRLAVQQQRRGVQERLLHARLIPRECLASARATARGRYRRGAIERRAGSACAGHDPQPGDASPNPGPGGNPTPKRQGRWPLPAFNPRGAVLRSGSSSGTSACGGARRGQLGGWRRRFCRCRAGPRTNATGESDTLSAHLAPSVPELGIWRYREKFHEAPGDFGASFAFARNISCSAPAATQAVKSRTAASSGPARGGMLSPNHRQTTEVCPAHQRRRRLRDVASLGEPCIRVSWIRDGVCVAGLGPPAAAVAVRAEVERCRSRSRWAARAGQRSTTATRWTKVARSMDSVQPSTRVAARCGRDAKASGVRWRPEKTEKTSDPRAAK